MTEPPRGIRRDHRVQQVVDERAARARANRILGMALVVGTTAALGALAYFLQALAAISPVAAASVVATILAGWATATMRVAWRRLS